MNKLIVIALVCLLTVSANAQFSFGIKAGYNRNGVYTRSNPIYPNYRSMDGFHIGLYSQFRLTDKLSLNPELQYIKKGPANFQYSNLNYMEMPVLLNFQAWKSLSIEVGPTIGAPIFGIDTIQDHLGLT